MSCLVGGVISPTKALAPRTLRCLPTGTETISKSKRISRNNAHKSAPLPALRYVCLVTTLLLLAAVLLLLQTGVLFEKVGGRGGERAKSSERVPRQRNHRCYHIDSPTRHMYSTLPTTNAMSDAPCRSHPHPPPRSPSSQSYSQAPISPPLLLLLLLLRSSHRQPPPSSRQGVPSREETGQHGSRETLPHRRSPPEREVQSSAGVRKEAPSAAAAGQELCSGSRPRVPRTCAAGQVETSLPCWWVKGSRAIHTRRGRSSPKTRWAIGEA